MTLKTDDNFDVTYIAPYTPKNIMDRMYDVKYTLATNLVIELKFRKTFIASQTSRLPGTLNSKADSIKYIPRSTYDSIKNSEIRYSTKPYDSINECYPSYNIPLSSTSNLKSLKNEPKPINKKDLCNFTNMILDIRLVGNNLKLSTDCIPYLVDGPGLMYWYEKEKKREFLEKAAEYKYPFAIVMLAAEKNDVEKIRKIKLEYREVPEVVDFCNKYDNSPNLSSNTESEQKPQHVALSSPGTVPIPAPVPARNVADSPLPPTPRADDEILPPPQIRAADKRAPWTPSGNASPPEKRVKASKQTPPPKPQRGGDTWAEWRAEEREALPPSAPQPESRLSAPIPQPAEAPAPSKPEPAKEQIPMPEPRLSRPMPEPAQVSFTPEPPRQPTRAISAAPAMEPAPAAFQEPAFAPEPPIAALEPVAPQSAVPAPEQIPPRAIHTPRVQYDRFEERPQYPQTPQQHQQPQFQQQQLQPQFQQQYQQTPQQPQQQQLQPQFQQQQLQPQFQQQYQQTPQQPQQQQYQPQYPQTPQQHQQPQFQQQYQQTPQPRQWEQYPPTPAWQPVPQTPQPVYAAPVQAPIVVPQTPQPFAPYAPLQPLVPMQVVQPMPYMVPAPIYPAQYVYPPPMQQPTGNNDTLRISAYIGLGITAGLIIKRFLDRK